MVIWFLQWLANATGWGKASDVLASLGEPYARAAIAAGLSVALTLVLGPRLISWLAVRFREPDKCPSATIRALHQGKRHTPTMGGMFLVAGLFLVVLLLADWHDPLVLLALGLTAALAVLGAADDLVKLRTSLDGISPRGKLLVQAVVAAAASLVLYRCLASSSEVVSVWLPGFGPVSIGKWYVPLAMLVIVAWCNAVNLTDGLDGLASGCLLLAVAALAVLLFVQRAAAIAPAAEAASERPDELLVVAGGVFGCLLGFLWFNRHPARVFMGNTGSLALGGLLALMALAARQELLLVLIGGVFVAEAGSVLVQVGAYKWLGRRPLRCAPLHHHFELQGWSESTIVARFWLAGGACAVAGAAVGLYLLAGSP